ncbi:MAG: hypothetical protein GX455_05270 [Phycisphaerae bacterium]|nr:hypothetical protein [Phycisphaerae bacterium]
MLASLLFGGFLMIALSLTAQPADKKISLLGTWEKVSDKVGAAKTFTPVAKGQRHLKMYTPTHWVAMSYDPVTHQANDFKGGPCTFSSDGMTEIVEFASNVAAWKSFFGQKLTYKIKLEGDTFIQSGQIGETKFEEVWKRAASPVSASSKSSASAAKPITLKGEAVCAKCILKQTPECQLAMRVETGGLSLAYFLEPNDVFKQFEASLADKKLDWCKTPVKVTATGAVAQIEGKPIFTATRLEQNP